MNTSPLKVLEKAQKLYRSHQHDEALATYHRYLGLRPAHAEAWADLGSLLLAMDKVDEAYEACERALVLDNKCLKARLTLAEVSVKKMDMDRATVLLGEAVRQYPKNLSVRTALETVLLTPGNDHDSRTAYKQYFGIDLPAEKVWDLACHNLLLGHMRLGWEYYESRWDLPKSERRPKEIMLAHPQWNGESFVGKTMLLRWEQGLGDVIMFIRYAPLVKARGGRVLVEVIEPLVDLVATCVGIDEVIKDGDPLPPFDLQLPLLSLPRIFQTNLDSIPADIPYLSVPSRVPHREGLDRIMTATECHTRVGLAWAGSPKHTRNLERNIPPALLKPLAALPVAWHSFQVGSASEQPFRSIIPMGPVINSSFSDTAYAISAMDLIITVDTSIAHVAGALGIPTFLLIAAIPDWRWLMGRDDTPWYPTMRIYRQPELGDWTSVIERVVADLGICR